MPEACPEEQDIKLLVAQNFQQLGDRWIEYQLQQVEVQHQDQHRVLSRPGEINWNDTTINFGGCQTKVAKAAQLAEPHKEPFSEQRVNTPV